MGKSQSSQGRRFGWSGSRNQRNNLSPSPWLVDGSYQQLYDVGYAQGNYSQQYTEYYNQYVQPTYTYTSSQFSGGNPFSSYNEVPVNMMQQFNRYENCHQPTGFTHNYTYGNEQTTVRRHSFMNDSSAMNDGARYYQRHEYRRSSSIDLSNRPQFRSVDNYSNLSRGFNNDFLHRSQTFSYLPSAAVSWPKRNHGKKRKLDKVDASETTTDDAGTFLKPKAKRQQVGCLTSVVPTSEKIKVTPEKCDSIDKELKTDNVKDKNQIDNENEKTEIKKTETEKMSGFSKDESTDNEKLEIPAKNEGADKNYESSKENRGLLYKAMFPKNFTSSPSKFKNSKVQKDFTNIFVPIDSHKGKAICRFFNKSNESRDYQLNIIAIEQIENPFLYNCYMFKKEEMRVLNGHVDELLLYHGTKRTNLQNIHSENLDWRRHSKNHMFGKGVNFSYKATYASHYCDKNGTKDMLLCKVLVGGAVGGNSHMSIPPTTYTRAKGGVVYDTSIKYDAQTIVKYNDNEFYPLYRISALSRKRFD